MRLRTGSLAALLFMAACIDQPAAPPEALPNPAPLLGASAAVQDADGEYIVVFRRDVGNHRQIGEAFLRQYGRSARHFYGAAIRGFAARLSPAALEAIRRNPNVEFVEADGIMTADGSQPNATWGLDRIDQRNLPLSTTYSWDNDGSGVVAYIIDTGIRTSHDEFGGRASDGFDAIDGSLPAADCNGHGTHVAGTVGGGTYGVAKNVTLIGVRVLGCNGSGSTSGVIAGIDWVAAHHGSGPAVANMSLGGGASTALDNAVRNAINDGVVFAVAAGNSNANACNYSPARTGEAITVGATTSSDARASYSNYGSCLDLFGPGSSITSAWYTTNSATNTISGTSMATPHVAGAAALYLQGNPSANPTAVRDAIVGAATTNVVTGAGSGSPNRLLYTGSGSPPPPPPSTVAVHVHDLAPSSSSGSRSRWNATVTIHVRDANGNPVSGATVAGAWSNGASGGSSCTTNSSGSCSSTKSNIRSNVSSVRWSVTGISGSNMTYDAGANVESSVVVNRP